MESILTQLIVAHLIVTDLQRENDTMLTDPCLFQGKLDHTGTRFITKILSATISDSEESDIVGNLDEPISELNYDCCEASSSKNDDIEVKDLADIGEVDKCRR
uniref:Uncharacterized protein n=1 Tax=Amphimedon queenslandica TaxID=400682 RepID=A0A1X7TLB7_AMPQE